MTYGTALGTSRAGQRDKWPDQAPERDLEKCRHSLSQAGIKVQNAEDGPDSVLVSEFQSLCSLHKGNKCPRYQFHWQLLKLSAHRGQTCSLAFCQHYCVEFFGAPVSIAPVSCGGCEDPVSCICKALSIGAVTQ